MNYILNKVRWLVSNEFYFEDNFMIKRTYKNNDIVVIENKK